MMRIGTYGAMQGYISRVLQTQQQVQTDQQQVSSGRKSSAYSGIAADSNQVLRYESEDNTISNFISTNNVVQTKLNVMSTSMQSIQDVINNFQNRLIDYQMSGKTDPTSVGQIQQFAFQSLLDMQDYLSTNVNGQYIFSGGRVNTAPVQLPASDLASFQGLYDGSDHSVGTVRSAQLLDYNSSQAKTGALTFDQVNGCIKAAYPGALAMVPAGTTLAVSNSLSNNTSFTVTRQAPCNNAGALLVPGSDNGAQITLANGVTIPDTASNGLTFAYNEQGMTITAVTPTALASMIPGTTFTISHDTNPPSTSTGAYDGTYTILSNSNGTVTVANDASQFTGENTATATVKLDTNGDGYGDTSQPVSGQVAFRPDPSNQGFLMTPAQASDTAAIANGSVITIGGTAHHNGTYTVLNRNADGSLVLAVSSPELQVSKFIPQAGRSDVTLTAVDNTQSPPLKTPFTSANYGTISFDPNGSPVGETITAGNANSFTDASGNPYPPAGGVINLTSTSGVNDGAYNVVSNNGTTIVISSTRVTAEAGSTTATFDASSWYKGDTIDQQQSVDTGRTLDVGLTAADPGFEKAIRAMEVIAQGKYGTAGGLDNHAERINAALYLLADSLQSPASGTAPYGTEIPGDLGTAGAKVADAANVIKNAADRMQQYSATIEGRISDLVNADPTQAITNLMHDTTALQSSYQALAKVQSLSLLDYLK